MKSEEREGTKQESRQASLGGSGVEVHNLTQRVKDILLAQPLNPLKEFTFSVLPRTDYGTH